MFTFDFTKTLTTKEELLDEIFDLIIEIVDFDKAEEALEELSSYTEEKLLLVKKEAENCLYLSLMGAVEVLDLNDIFDCLED